MSDEQRPVAVGGAAQSADVKPTNRIIQFSSDGGLLQVLGSDGRMWLKKSGAWVELPSYPPGLAPSGMDRR